MALSLAMMALIEPGDEVLYPDPGFPIYPSFTLGLGATAVAFGLEEKNNFQPDLDEIAAKITPRTTALIFNSPNNPTGTVFNTEALRRIARAGREARPVDYCGRNLCSHFVQRGVRIDLVVAGNGRREQ